MEELYNNRSQETTDQRNCMNLSDTNLDFHRWKKKFAIRIII
jgi:hypothetical protein